MPLERSNGYVSGLRPIKEKGTNPKDELGMLKVPLGLVSQTASVLQAICMQDGSEKYGPYNYRKSKVQGLIYLEALMRHVAALIDGEDFDPKSGKPHIGYILATAQIYADAWVNGNLIDTRPLPARTGELITAFSRSPGEPELTPEQYRAIISSMTGAQNEAGAPKGVHSSRDGRHRRNAGNARRSRRKGVAHSTRRRKRQ